jgi:hypothetical protein
VLAWRIYGNLGQSFNNHAQLPYWSTNIIAA